MPGYIDLYETGITSRSLPAGTGPIKGGGVPDFRSYQNGLRFDNRVHTSIDTSL
jgi:hypothetical protein